MILKNLLNNKDKIILSLCQDLELKNSNIKKLNNEIMDLKREKQEQENSFQNIIKDFHFLNEYNSNNTNLNSSNISNKTENEFEIFKRNNYSTNKTKAESNLSTSFDNFNTLHNHNRNKSYNTLQTANKFNPIFSKDKNAKNPYSNFNQNSNASQAFNNEEKESLLNQIDLIGKEKNALESQLVIIKLKYAEISSSFGELQDENNVLSRKVEELNQKLILKEDVISHLISEKEKFHITPSSNSNPTKKEELRKIYVTNETPVKLNPNPNGIAYTQRNSFTDMNINKNTNIDYSTYENLANEKIIKKIQYNFDESQYSKRTNYNTTVGNEYIDSENAGGISNTDVYNKTEHQQRLENYKMIQKNQKTKSIGFIGSIKNFFANDKK